MHALELYVTHHPILAFIFAMSFGMAVGHCLFYLILVLNWRRP